MGYEDLVRQDRVREMTRFLETEPLSGLAELIVSLQMQIEALEAERSEEDA